MDLQLADKVALVTAASQGIGKGVALGLAREGCRVVIASSSAPKLAAAKEEIERAGGRGVETCVMDQRREASVQEAAADIASRVGPIDILVTNGPGPKPSDAAPLDLPLLDETIQANFRSVVQLCNAVLPSMMQRQFGRIINLTSSTGKEPDAGLVLSNVTRAAVLAYAKTLSREVARHGITVNSILTGSVMTARAMQLFEADSRDTGRPVADLIKEAGDTIPVGYISTPEQFAHAIVFLASPLSMYVNGVSLAIDGGYMRAI